jgi:hypothetical protein
MDREKLIKAIRLSIARVLDFKTDQTELECLADHLIANSIGDITAEKHRADVAEEALKLATEKAYEIRTNFDTISCSSCWLADEIGMCERDKNGGLYNDCVGQWLSYFKQIAEARLKEMEGKSNENSVAPVLENNND